MTQILLLSSFTMDVETQSNSNEPASLAFTTEVSDEPIDLTGIAFKLHLRYPRSSRTVPLVGDTADNSIIITGVDSNYLTFAFTLEQMEALPPGEYLYDLIATADGISVLVASGSWTHILGITR